MKRIIRTVALSLVGAIVLTVGACATRAGSDNIILYYRNGAGDNKTFKECIQPGKKGSYPIDDQIFALPTSLRTWNIRPDGGDSKNPIKSGSKPVGSQPGPEVAVYTSTDFYLNTDCSGGKTSPVVQFWETTGRRYNVSADGEDGFDDGAWRKMLIATLVTAQEKAIRERTRDFTADQLDANLDDAWKQIEQAMASGFAQELRAKLGGDYFCGVGYKRGKTVEWDETTRNPDGAETIIKKTGACPPVRVVVNDVNFVDPGITEARNKVFKAKQEAEAKLIEARADVEKARLLDEAARKDAYVRLREIEAQLEAAKACAANDKCTLIIGADGVVVGR